MSVFYGLVHVVARFLFHVKQYIEVDIKDRLIKWRINAAVEGWSEGGW